MTTHSIDPKEPVAQEPFVNGGTANGRGLELGKEGRREAMVRRETVPAIISIAYLVLMLALFGWQLFDTWMESHFLVRKLGYDLARLAQPDFHLIAYSVIGGALGATINGIRSFLIYYEGFSERYIWKYLLAPWMGSTLGLIVYALIHSSATVFSGNTAAEVGGTQALANFAAGALAGYGSKDVFIWLDARVESLFKVTQEVPDVTGQSEEIATSVLHSRHLAKGPVAAAGQAEDEPPGTVVEQVPLAETTAERGAEVALTVAAGASDQERKPSSRVTS